MSSVKNKVILITGANSGLGTDLVSRLQEENELILVSKSENKKFQTSDALHFIQADITEGEALEKKIVAILEKIGKKIDGIVNTAALPDRKLFSETSYQAIHDVVATKVIGFANTIHACLPYLNTNSSIVNLSSVHAYSTAEESRTMYSAANAGVIGLTKALSVSKDLRRIAGVNVVIPGGFLTDEYKESYPDWEDKLLKGQILPIEDISNVILFLLSDESHGINGAEIKVEVGVGNLRASSSKW